MFFNNFRNDLVCYKCGGKGHYAKRCSATVPNNPNTVRGTNTNNTQKPKWTCTDNIYSIIQDARALGTFTNGMVNSILKSKTDIMSLIQVLKANDKLFRNNYCASSIKVRIDRMKAAYDAQHGYDPTQYDFGLAEDDIHDTMKSTKLEVAKDILKKMTVESVRNIEQAKITKYLADRFKNNKPENYEEAKLNALTQYYEEANKEFEKKYENELKKNEKKVEVLALPERSEQQIKKQIAYENRQKEIQLQKEKQMLEEKKRLEEEKKRQEKIKQQRQLQQAIEKKKNEEMKQKYISKYSDNKEVNKGKVFKGLEKYGQIDNLESLWSKLCDRRRAISKEINRNNEIIENEKSKWFGTDNDLVEAKIQLNTRLQKESKSIKFDIDNISNLLAKGLK